MQVVYFIILLFLFFILGKSADFLIDGIKSLGLRLRIKTLYLGFALGLITTTPEIFIGISALSEGVGSIAFGNLLGGVIVLLGLIMGINIILRKGIELKSTFNNIFLIFLALYFSLAILFVFSGNISQIEGMILIIGYLLISVFFLKYGGQTLSATPRKSKASLKNTLITTIVGFVGVIMLSKLIMSITMLLLSSFNIPNFMIGVIVFSLGTNLPELVIVIESWRKRISYIAIGNLLGSATANIFVVGVFAIMKPVFIVINYDFYIFIVAFLVITLSFIIFSKTGKRLRVREGLALIMFYVIFLIFAFMFKN